VVFEQWTIWDYLRRIQSLEIVGNKVKVNDDLTKIEGKREEVDNSKKIKSWFDLVVRIFILEGYNLNALKKWSIILIFYKIICLLSEVFLLS
jgi:hypothetical protein